MDIAPFSHCISRTLFSHAFKFHSGLFAARRYQVTDAGPPALAAAKCKGWGSLTCWSPRRRLANKDLKIFACGAFAHRHHF